MPSMNTSIDEFISLNRKCIYWVKRDGLYKSAHSCLSRFQGKARHSFFFFWRISIDVFRRAKFL